MKTERVKYHSFPSRSALNMLKMCKLERNYNVMITTAKTSFQVFSLWIRMIGSHLLKKSVAILIFECFTAAYRKY